MPSGTPSRITPTRDEIDMTTSASDLNVKIRENRLRRAAHRQGMTLRKSRRRDVWAVDHGAYWLMAHQHNALVLGGEFGTDLDAVEAYLLDD